MRKTGIFAIVAVAALMMVMPGVAINSEAVDSWDSISSAYSMDGNDVSYGIYSSLTNDYDKHIGMYVLDKTGFNFLANEDNGSMGIVGELSGISMGDGIIKSISNKYEVQTVAYKELKADLSISATVYDNSKSGSLVNDLYTNDDRGFSELRSYLGLTDIKSFNNYDVFSMDCHVESYIKETTTMYYRETVAGDYYETKVVVEVTEVLHVSSATFSYKSYATGETTTIPCSIDLTGTTRTITDYDYGAATPVTGVDYNSRTYVSSSNDGTANYTFSGSTHTATMTNPQSTTTGTGKCEAKTYDTIIKNVSTSNASDLYPDTSDPEVYINSIKDVVIHTKVSDVENDIICIEKEYGLIKEEKDTGYLKIIAYAVAIVLVVAALIFLYIKFIRKRD